MKKQIGVLFMVLIFIWLPLPVFAADVEEEYTLDVSKEQKDLEDAVRLIEEQLEENYAEINLLSFLDQLRSGDLELNWENVRSFAVNFFWGEVGIIASLLAQLFILGVIAALFNTMQDSFGDGRLSVVGQWVIFLTFAAVALKSLQTVLAVGTQAIEMAANLMYALLPLLLTVLSSLGGVTSMLVVKPTLIFVITLFLGILERFLLPLVLFLAVLALVNHVSPKFSFSHLSKLMRDVILISLSLMLTVFTALLSLEGLASAAIDGVGLKTAKDAIGNFIPIVGSHIAGALDTLMGASLILKNTVGVFGLLAIVVVIALPAPRILLMSLCFRIAGVVLEPFGNTTFTKMLADFSSALTTLFAIVAAAGLFFFIALFIIVGLGNITMMFR